MARSLAWSVAGKACVAGVAEWQTYHFRRLFFATFFWRTKESKVNNRGAVEKVLCAPLRHP